MQVTRTSFFTTLFLASILGGLVVYLLIENVGSKTKPKKTYVSISQRQDSGISIALEPLNQTQNFQHAASKVLPGVVSIHTYYHDKGKSNPLDAFFDSQPQSSGSGVIISDDGYIATNRHVIENAERIEVLLQDNRSYFATLIGEDETTDLALLRIDERNLKYVKYGNSDQVIPGEWVLAIGNPFDLYSTVTAGIVSAKARNIGILRTRSNLQIESFIQTDAAVNPGNSGGALINLNGELIGINTAIATQTGSFQGYSFAIPVTLVKKVMDDLLEYGEVKRGLLGVIINDVNARLAESYDLNVVNGVFIRSVNENSAGNEAGLKSGDIIIGVNGKVVTNTSELQELVARNRPGDKIEISYIRNKEEYNVTVTLRDFQGNAGIISLPISNTLEGAQLKNLGDEAGVEITKINQGKFQEHDFHQGDVITHIDKARIHSITELINTFDSKSGPVMIEGVDEKGKRFLRAIEW